MKQEDVNCILDLGSTKLRFSVISQNLSKEIYFNEKEVKNSLTNKEVSLFNSEQILDEIIKEAEKKIGFHLNNLSMLVDSRDIINVDLSIKNNFEGKKISNTDVNYLLLESKKIVQENYKDYFIIHSIIQKYILDEKIFTNISYENLECNNLSLEIKFICFPKEIYKKILNLLNKNQVELKNFGCSSYIKSKSYNSQFQEYELKIFLDIGYNKTILTIYNHQNILCFFKVIKIGSQNITNDISIILKIKNYEAEILKKKLHQSEITFSDKTETNYSNQMDLLKKIIFARIEEIFNLTLNNIYLFDEIKKKKSILIFTGEGSKILENNSIYLDNFFECFNDIHYFEESPSGICMGAHNLYRLEILEKNKTPTKDIQKRGIFEKIFKLLSKI